MVGKRIEENRRALDSLVNNPVALTIIGLGKAVFSYDKIYFDSDMKKIYQVFKDLKKDFPNAFEKVKFDEYNYSPEVQRGIDLFIGNGIIFKGFNNFERYCVNKRRIYEIYKNLGIDKKFLADELGTRFYSALKTN